MKDEMEKTEETPTPDDSSADEEHSTQGTMVIMLFYLVVTIGIWGAVYLVLLQRG